MVTKGLRLAVLLLLYITCCYSVQAARFLVPFDIPPGPLAVALIEFADQSKISLLVSKTSVAELKVGRLKGVMTLRQALNRLLLDSRLGYKFLDQNTVSISPDFFTPVELVIETKELQPVGLAPDEIHIIEEVTVTAGREAENLQKVPMAVSVLNDLTLQISDIKNLGDIASRTPGLTVSSFSLGQPSIHMRGIGSNDDGAAMDNSVVVFLDDVYIGRISTIDLNVMDLERVEVLRGPQGTLYGKNAIGGAVRLISKAASSDPQLRLRLTAGNYDARGFNILANGPLSDTWQGRLSIDARQRKGWQENLILAGEKQHASDSWGMRSKLHYVQDDKFTAQWSLDYSRDNYNSTGRIPIRSDVPIAVLDDHGNRILLSNINGKKVYQTKLPTDIFSELGGTPLKATNGMKGFTDREIWGLNQRVSGQASGGSWVSISSYRDSQFQWLEDSIGLPGFVTDQTIGSYVVENHQQLSQELRWVSDPEQQSYSYVLGLYYLYEHTIRDEKFPFSNSTANTLQDNRTNSYAAFGQLRYQFNPLATLILGIRYNTDTKKLDQTSLNGGAPAIILEDFQLSSKASWQDLSPRLAFSYQLEDEQLLYGSIARGMKSGGFQGAPSTRALAQRTIAPESAWAYELGFKSQWLEDRLRLNLAAFYTDYQDLQVVQFQRVDNFGMFQTDNAASASLRGLELEFETQLMDGLLVSGSYAFLRATYDSFNDLQGRDFTGNRLRQAPKQTVNIALQYEHALGHGVAQWHSDFRYQSQSFREPDNITQQPAYGLVDAGVSYLSDSNWEVSLWAKNLFNKEYIAHLYVLGGNDYAIFGTPRTFGITLSLNFN